MTTTQEHNQKAKKQSQSTKKQRSCRTKKVYFSMKEADRSVAHLHGKGIYVKPYECSICGKYHLTKRTKENILADLFKQIEKERIIKKEKQ